MLGVWTVISIFGGTWGHAVFLSSIVGLNLKHVHVLIGSKLNADSYMVPRISRNPKVINPKL